MLRRLKTIFYYSKADAAMRRGRFDRAASDLSKVLQANRDNAAAHHDRGVALQGMGNYRGAIDEFDRAIAINPRLATAYASRGISWKFLGDFDRAIADQTDAIALAPRLSDPHGELGVVHYCKQDFDEAILSLNTAIALAPRNPEYVKYRGITLFCRGDFQAAAIDLKQAFDIAHDVYALLFLCLARVKMGEVTQLETEARKLRNWHWPSAITELYLGKRPASSVLAAAGTADERAEAQFYLGQWHLCRGNRDEARIALQAAAQSCPKWFVEHTAAVAELERLS